MARDGKLLGCDDPIEMDATSRTGTGSGDDDPLGCSDLWAAYVEARDRYRRVATTRAHDFAAIVEAREVMNEAYRRWSES